MEGQGGTVKVRILNFFIHGGKDMWPGPDPVETSWERAQQWINRGNAAPYQEPGLVAPDAAPTKAPLKLTPAQVVSEDEDESLSEESEETQTPAATREKKITSASSKKPATPKQPAAPRPRKK